MVLNTLSLEKEARKLRTLIEQCDAENTDLILNDFPIMSCKLASMILVYHYLKLFPRLEIKGIGGEVVDNAYISHYWLEVNDIVIDITGDQYNLIEDAELNTEIIKNRPFVSVHVSPKQESYLYGLFNVAYVDKFIFGLPDVHEDFIEKLERTHTKLLSLDSCT